MNKRRSTSSGNTLSAMNGYTLACTIPYNWQQNQLKGMQKFSPNFITQMLTDVQTMNKIYLGHLKQQAKTTKTKPVFTPTWFPAG